MISYNWYIMYIIQNINNSDFEIEIKFETGVDAPNHEEQGVFVKESDSKYLRFDFYNNG